jgi:hypothetical protein
MKKLFIVTFKFGEMAYQKFIFANDGDQVHAHFTKKYNSPLFSISNIEEVEDISEHMHIITHTIPSSDPYFINVSFSVKRNDGEWTSQPYHLPIEVWNEQKEIELKEEFKQFVLSKSTD